MTGPRKWFPRIIGEDANNYLTTITNFDERKEKSAKWLPKNDETLSHLIPAWEKLRVTMWKRIEPAQHNYIPYNGNGRVEPHFIYGQLMIYVDIQPQQPAVAREIANAAQGQVYSVRPFTVHDNDRQDEAVLLPGRERQPQPSQTDQTQQAAEVPKPQQCGHDTSEAFICTGYRHTETKLMSGVRSCKSCIDQSQTYEHGASFPICFACTRELIFAEITSACECFKEKCFACIQANMDDMEAQRGAMTNATMAGTLCSRCSGPVGEFKEASMCIVCGGVNVQPIR